MQSMYEHRKLASFLFISTFLLWPTTVENQGCFGLMGIKS